MSDDFLQVLTWHGHPDGVCCEEPDCYQRVHAGPKPQVEDDAPVMAIIEGDNTDVIEACHRLGYINDHDYVLDPTYGKGRWWTKWRPAVERFNTSDIDPERSLPGPIDFRDMPYDDSSFDVVAFDPPYKLNGTGGSHASDEAYGVAGAYTHWTAKHRLITDGMTECARVLRPGGRLLLKCQDQVSSGQVRWQTFEFAGHAATLNLTLIDMLHLVSYRAQPDGRRQLHARRNYSTMMIFAKAKR